ncbi:Nonsense-mediated mRNA decay protein 5 [Linderina pennispora]|nr:Nonsense-mediated mRNA decay protein 5 [Linderina pennispora]
MAPFAVQLAQQLCDTFMRIMGDITVNTPDISTVDIDDISDKTMAAMGVLKTLGTLVLNLESSADVVFKLEEVIFPIVRFVLDQRLVDLYDEVYEILDCCTFAVKTISPNAWSLFDVIYTTFKNDSSDFIEEMLPSLDNFVSYGMDVVSTNSEVQSRLFDIIETVMKSERAGESERICACKLAEAIMLNGRGKVDGMIPGLISLAAAYLLVNDAIQTRGFLVYTLEVILNALYYNPVITLSVLEQFQWTSGIFTRLVQSIDKFTRVNDKKLVVLGLTSLLSVPADQLPASLQAGLPQVFEGILQTFHTLGEAVEARDALERMYDGTGDDFDGDYEWDGVQDELVDDDLAEDDADELQQEYLRQLAGRAGEALGEGAEGEFDDDDEDDYDEALEEELAFESPLDAVKPHVWLQDKLAEMQSSNPATYNVIVQSLNPEKSQFLQTLMDEAIKQRSEQQ